MSSILTNNGAMVALQTLKSINKGLSETQSIISTGKSVANSKDNAAVWAISKVMESDVSGFKAISSSLSLGESTVAVGRQAAETVNDLLTQMKDKIVASQESNVDRAKIQTDIAALRDQITSVVGAAQFNGLNLLSNTSKTAGSGNVEILSSLDRSGTGVQASEISVSKQDLGTGATVLGTTTGTSANAGTAGTVAAGATGGLATFTAPTTIGSVYSITAVGGTALTSAATYVSRDGDTLADVVREMASRVQFQAQNQGLDVTMSAGTAAGSLNVTNNTSAALVNVAASATQGLVIDATATGKIGGGLEYLSKVDVTTTNGAKAALGLVEGLITTAIESASAFGSAQKRIETQSDFVGKLTDALKSGIGSLVDANMEEASARLQALQVQQQLGVQSLSIANQAPQSILSLFR